jgi:prepilin-type N-terminal cleavage/methylation domain-containing protein
MKRFSQYQHGYSLIELLIVMTLSVMLIVAASGIMMTALLNNGRVNVQKTIKQNGDHAMGQMTTRLRNAIKLVANSSGQTCAPGMSEIRFQSLDEGITTFSAVEIEEGDTRIASGSGSIYLTSDAVKLDSLVFDCTRADDGSSSSVKITFTLSKGQVGEGRATDYGLQEFTGNVTLRSF